MRRNLKIATLLLVSLATMGIFSASASASLSVSNFVTTSSNTSAGAHPDLTTEFSLDQPGVAESASNVIFDAPEGVFGNPGALLRCTSADFAQEQCPSTSQAGVVTIYANVNGNQNELLGTAPIFNLEPGDNTALFALIVPILRIPIQIPVAVRTDSDYGLRFRIAELTQLAPLAGAKLTFWGFPSSSVHDSERFPRGGPGEPAGCPNSVNTSCTIGTPSSHPNSPLTDNPTICTGQPLTTRLEVQTYQDPGHPTVATGSYPSTTTCEREDFKPVIYSSLTTSETDSPSGLNLELRAPQYFGLTPSPSQLRTAIVTLPPEMTINPDAADGQSACSEIQASFRTLEPARCPDNSKIGTFSVNTPALDGPLNGSLFIGEPKPGEQYRLFMVADGFGLHVKLVGTAVPDPQTGRLEIRFVDLPQVPFDNFQVHLFASDRGLIATPTHCTLHPISAHFYPWNSRLPDVVTGESVGLDSGPGGSPCPALIRPFHPRLAAGTSNPTAGDFSTFTLKLDRDDGDQYLGDLSFTMPPGLTASLRGIEYCPEAAVAVAGTRLGRDEQSRPSCPSASQIGTTNVAAGPGSHPFHAVGKMYLAGPFKGDPLSLVTLTPALAGPYDYGTVVVRVGVDVDATDAHVIAVSDTVPSIVGGIPLRIRSIQVNIDRSNFMINPTRCSPFSVESGAVGDQGTATTFSSYFQSVNCATLPFKPKMTVTQGGGKGSTKRSKNPSLQFDLRTRPGDANIRSMSVTLSKAFAIDQRHLGNLCSEGELIKTKCAGRQPIGSAFTQTPLLDRPLTGKAYAVSGSGGLPKLAILLDGQVAITPRGVSASDKSGALKTRVPVVPDVPIGHFQLTIFGGSTGYLVNTRSLCSQTPINTIEYVAQNGKTLKQKAKTKVGCGKSRSKKK